MYMYVCVYIYVYIYKYIYMIHTVNFIGDMPIFFHFIPWPDPFRSDRRSFDDQPVILKPVAACSMAKKIIGDIVRLIWVT